MSHSKGTTNYNLPLFTKDDRPAWLTDFNSAMLEVDAVVKGLSDKVKAGGLPTSGGTMDGNINMNEHALTNVQEIEMPSSGNGLYVGAVVQDLLVLEMRMLLHLLSRTRRIAMFR